jgi:hypothetical protein
MMCACVRRLLLKQAHPRTRTLTRQSMTPRQMARLLRRRVHLSLVRACVVCVLTHVCMRALYLCLLCSLTVCTERTLVSKGPRASVLLSELRDIANAEDDVEGDKQGDVATRAAAAAARTDDVTPVAADAPAAPAPAVTETPPERTATPTVAAAPAADKATESSDTSSPSPAPTAAAAAVSSSTPASTDTTAIDVSHEKASWYHSSMSRTQAGV